MRKYKLVFTRTRGRVSQHTEIKNSITYSTSRDLKSFNESVPCMRVYMCVVLLFLIVEDGKVGIRVLSVGGVLACVGL